MAFVNTPAATLRFDWVDGSGTRGATLIHVPFGTAVAAVLTAADVLRPLLGALSDAVIIGQSLTYSYTETELVDPDPSSRVEEKGVFSWNTSNGRKAQFTIPAIKDGVLNTSGSINRTNLGVGALIIGVTDVDAIFCGADGSDISSINKAYQRFNSSTRRQLPSDR